ncbi:unnamed protein product [Calypogeia fissa]
MDENSAVAVALLDGEAPQRKKNWEGDWPKSIKYLIWNEFCERFSFYGLKTILALFLLEHLHISENGSAELVHLFIVLCYFTPILGAILSDAVVGKFRTILWLSIIYSVGNCVLSAAAVPDTDSSNSLAFWMTSAGLVLIALGTGGIKPCVSAFGGDQIELGLPEGPVKERLQRQFFSMYYFAVNAGALISTLLTPVLRTNVSYAVAFSVPAALMIVAVAIFWAGSKHYIDRKPEGNVFAQVGSVIYDAVKFNLFPSAGARATSHEIDEETHFLEGSEGPATHEKSMKWLDPAKRTQGAIPVDDVKSLLAVVVILLPAPLFWALSDQQSSKWVFQGSNMNRKMPWWLGGIVVDEDQMQALNPVLVLGMIPIFYQGIYPFLESRGWPLKPIPRMWIGIALSAVAFIISALIQIWMDLAGEPLSILWQVPQYIIVTAGEILFSITGLEFAYSQAPESMKSVVQAVWLFCVAGGNLVTVIIIAIIGDRLSSANEYFFFAFLAAIATLVMIWLGSGFEYKHEGEAKPLPDSDETSKIQ